MLISSSIPQLTQEKNELREEKASLKSDIENLNAQYQQRLRVMFPWATMDPSVVMGPPYSYPVPVPVPPGPIPMHPSLQPFTFFGNQNPGAIPNPCSTFVPYTAAANHPIDQPSAQYASNSHISSKQDSRSKSSDQHRRSNVERCDESTDVATDLELKMPGSSTMQVILLFSEPHISICRSNKNIIEYVFRMHPLEVRKVSNRKGKKKVLQIVVLRVDFLHPKFFKIALLTALATSQNKTTEFKVTVLVKMIKFKITVLIKVIKFKVVSSPTKYLSSRALA